MYGGLGIEIVLALLQLIKGAAQVSQGAFRPVELILHLHLQIDQGIVIHKDSDVKDEFLLIDGFPQLNGIGDLDGTNLTG